MVQAIGSTDVRRLFARTRSEAPFLFGERGALALTRELSNVGGGAEDFGEEPEQSQLQLRGQFSDRDLTGRSFFACDASGATFTKLVLEKSRWARSHLRQARLSSVRAEESDWDVIDMEGAALERLEARGARFSLVSFRDAELSGCILSGATFVLCDFSGARITESDLSGARFIGCDFDGACLEGVDATGADLRSSSFRGAWLGEAQLDGVQAERADFRHAGFSSDAQRLLLEGRGARTGGGQVLRLWARLLGEKASGHRRARRATEGTWALLALLVPVLFFARAACNPVQPDYSPSVQWEEGEPEDFEPAPGEAPPP